MYLFESLVFLTLLCAFVWKVTGCVFDFIHTPISDIVQLRHIFVSFVFMCAGAVSSAILLALANKP